MNHPYADLSKMPDASGRIAYAERGFSLVELMVALAVGLIVMIAIMYATTGSKGSSKFNQELARLQENGRVAITILEEDLRGAAYLGCGGRRLFKAEGGVDRDAYLRGVNAQKYSTLAGDFDETTPPMTGLADSDVLLVLGAGGQSYVLEESMAGGKVKVNNDADALGPVAQNDLLLITDCTRTDLFAVDGAGASGVNEIGATGTGLERDYGVGSQVVRFFSSAFFVRQVPNAEGNDLRKDRAGSDVYSLLRKQNSGEPSEIAEGVAAFKLCLGVDNDGDGAVDEYKSTAAAPAAWDNVLSVRADLLLASVSPTVLAEPVEQEFTLCDGSTFSETDMRLRKLFTTTVALRNRIH